MISTEMMLKMNVFILLKMRIFLLKSDLAFIMVWCGRPPSCQILQRKVKSFRPRQLICSFIKKIIICSFISLRCQLKICSFSSPMILEPFLALFRIKFIPKRHLIFLALTVFMERIAVSKRMIYIKMLRETLYL